MGGGGCGDAFQSTPEAVRGLSVSFFFLRYLCLFFLGYLCLFISVFGLKSQGMAARTQIGG